MADTGPLGGSRPAVPSTSGHGGLCPRTPGIRYAGAPTQESRVLGARLAPGMGQEPLAGAAAPTWLSLRAAALISRVVVFPGRAEGDN